MVPSPSEQATAASPSGGSSTLINGLLGGFAGILLSFIPFAAIVGGVLAGYLEGGQPTDGLKPGAIAGLVMFLPVTFIVFFLLFIMGMAGTPAAIGILGIVILLFSALYSIGSGVLGGYLGVYLKNEL
jgi:hypothetical protein